MDRITNKAGVAKFFGVSQKTVDDWILRGAPVEAEGGKGIGWKIDLLKVAEWKFAPRRGDGVNPDSLPPADRKNWYDGTLKKFQLEKEQGAHLERSYVRQSTSTAYHHIAQTLLSIPDLIERRLGVSPEVAEGIEQIIHEAMAELAYELDRLCEDGSVLRDETETENEVTSV